MSAELYERTLNDKVKGFDDKGAWKDRTGSALHSKQQSVML